MCNGTQSDLPADKGYLDLIAGPILRTSLEAELAFCTLLGFDPIDVDDFGARLSEMSEQERKGRMNASWEIIEPLLRSGKYIATLEGRVDDKVPELELKGPFYDQEN